MLAQVLGYQHAHFQFGYHLLLFGYHLLLRSSEWGNCNCWTSSCFVSDKCIMVGLRLQSELGTKERWVAATS
jgi:hypothetical protein